VSSVVLLITGIISSVTASIVLSKSTSVSPIITVVAGLSSYDLKKLNKSIQG